MELGSFSSRDDGFGLVGISNITAKQNNFFDGTINFFDGTALFDRIDDTFIPHFCRT